VCQIFFKALKQGSIIALKQALDVLKFMAIEDAKTKPVFYKVQEFSFPAVDTLNKKNTLLTKEMFTYQN
jgi:hypothetical protein